MLFHVHSHFAVISFLDGSHTSAVDGENFLRWIIIPKKDCNCILLWGAFFF